MSKPPVKPTLPFKTRIMPTVAMATAVALAGVCDDMTNILANLYPEGFPGWAISLFSAIFVTLFFGTPFRMLILAFVKRPKLSAVLTAAIQVPIRYASSTLAHFVNACLASQFSIAELHTFD